MSEKGKQLQERIEILEAERVMLTVELRNELLKAAHELLPEAIRQAKPRKERGRPGEPGNASLLRLIARVAMRDVRLDRKPKTASNQKNS